MKFTDDELRSALVETNGDVRAVADKLHVTLGAVRNRISLLGKVRRSQGRPKGSFKEASKLKPQDVGRFQLHDRIKREFVAKQPKLHSRAQRMLQALLMKRGTTSKVASEVGVGTSMLRHLHTGRAPLPSLALAVELEKRYGIPCVAWLEKDEG